MDFVLKLFQALYVAGVFRQKRVKHRLVLARRIKAALDAELGNQLVEPERTANDPDRTDNGIGIGDDFIGGTSDHVAAGSGGVLDECDNAAFLFLRELTDTAPDQMRLGRRSPWRVDGQRDGR